MELHSERLIPASVNDTWAALNDPAVLKACITGCESLERTADDAFTAQVAVKVGPVSARFKGNLKLTDVQPPHGYTIHFDGQGGIAGFGKGSADVKLVPEGTQTRLAYAARAQVGGKLAQIGSRLVDAAAGKIAEDFFKAFEAHVQTAGAAQVEKARIDAEVDDVAREKAVAGSDAEPTALPRAVTSAAPSALPAPTSRRVVWVSAALALVALLYFSSR